MPFCCRPAGSAAFVGPGFVESNGRGGGGGGGGAIRAVGGATGCVSLWP